MPQPFVIEPQHVHAAWAAMADWSNSQARREAKRFTEHQPAVVAYVSAVLEDESVEAMGLGLQVAHAIDDAYARARGERSQSVSLLCMESAADFVDERFASVADTEPEFAMRKMLFDRDFGGPALLVEFIPLLMAEIEADPELEAALGPVFITTFAVARAYEHAHGLDGDDAAKHSLAEAMEKRLGGPLPKIGRNEPCPCGSGLKFKKCCGLHAERSTDPEPEPLPGQLIFNQHMALVSDMWRFFLEVKRGRDGRWWRKQDKEFESEFNPGEFDGVPDSFHMQYMLFDLREPKSGKTIGDLFHERNGRQLDAANAGRLQRLRDSYFAFYEVLGAAEPGMSRLRELVTNTEWLVNDLVLAVGEEDETGDIWLCRLVGPTNGAAIMMPPLPYPGDFGTNLEEFAQSLVEKQIAAGASPAEALKNGMKEAGPLLADFILATMGDFDEDIDHDDFDDDEED